MRVKTVLPPEAMQEAHWHRTASLCRGIKEEKTAGALLDCCSYPLHIVGYELYRIAL